jgi:hypothetical protein
VKGVQENFCHYHLSSQCNLTAQIEQVQDKSKYANSHQKKKIVFFEENLEIMYIFLAAISW